MKRRMRCTVHKAILLVSFLSLVSAGISLGQTAREEAAGQSTTLLPDGRLLMTGGEGPLGPLAAASIADPRTGEVTTLTGGLALGRARHTATMLPDGTVLIVGGFGPSGRILNTAELFEPETKTFHLLPEALPTPRASHSSTLLTDGRIIIAGGISADGRTLAEVDAWDFRTRSFSRLPALLATARSGHTASLRGDGRVVVRGGIGPDGRPVLTREVYDPIHGTFTPAPVDARTSYGPNLEASVPEDGSFDAPVDTIIALRFSQPVQVETINAATVILSASDGTPLPVKLVPAEGGMLLFLTPMRVLEPGVTYTVSLRGVMASEGVSLPSRSLRFTTANERETGIPSALPGTPAPTARLTSSGIGRPFRSADAVPPQPNSPVFPTWYPPEVDGPRERCLNFENDPVDCSNGLFVQAKTDFYLPDVIPLSLTRTYRTGDNQLRPFGNATHPYEIFIQVTDYPNTYLWADLWLEDGARIHYDRITPGSDAANTVMEHTSTPGPFYKSRLETNDGAWWYVILTNGTQYVFHMDMVYPPALWWIQDRNGNRVTITRVATDPTRQGDIKRITSPNGRYIEFTYGAYHNIIEARDNAGRVVKYEYDSDRRLTKVTDAAGGVTEYTYDSSHRMRTIKDARGIVYVTNEYDANGRVMQQTMADGAVWSYTYSLDSKGIVKQTDVTDPRGTIIRKTFNGDGYTLTNTLISGRDQQKVTLDRQTGSNLVTRLTDPLSRKTDYAYDSCGNVTSVTRMAGTQQAVNDHLHLSDGRDLHRHLQPAHQHDGPAEPHHHLRL